MQRNRSLDRQLTALWFTSMVVAIQMIGREQLLGEPLLLPQAKQKVQKTTDSQTGCVGLKNKKKFVRLNSEDLLSLVLEKKILDPPALLGKNNLHGIVKVEVLIKDNGQVHCVLGRSGHALARDSAVRSISKWVFKPYVVDGKAKAVVGVLSLPYDFRH